MKHILGILLLIWCSLSYSQRVTIVDSLSLNPVPFATIASVDGNQGYVADEFGKVTVDSSVIGKQFEIRSIGYKRNRINGQSLLASDSVFVHSLIFQLDEVIVRPIPANEFVIQAMNSIDKNYRIDSFHSQHYYREWLKENNTFLRYTEAFLEVEQPGYFVENDSFQIGLMGGNIKSKKELNFMQKEVEKEQRKDLKKAKRKGEEVDPNEMEMPLELGQPHLILLLDPIRHPDMPVQVNNNNADFLDEESHEDYDFWYGKPVPYGDKTLVVVHFDQKESVKASLFSGTLWIDQETDAFVKIEFGFSEKGMKHLIPGYAKALLWLYGLNYQVKNTLIQFEYLQFEDQWLLASTRLKAELLLEKRRFFSENESGNFVYECEMLTSKAQNERKPIQSTLLKKDEVLSKQVENLIDNRWQSLKNQSRSINSQQ